MTHLYVVAFNNAQRRIIMGLAARDDLTIERWVARASLLEAERRLDPAPKAPRYEPARKRPTFNSPTLVACPHCNIPTRPVKSCDNCDKEIA